MLSFWKKSKDEPEDAQAPDSAAERPPEPEPAEDDAPDSDDPELIGSEPHYSKGPPPAAPTAPDRPPADKPGWFGLFRRRQERRDLQNQAVQAGYIELLDLIRSIRTHLERQSDVQDRLVQTLDKLPDDLRGNREKIDEQLVESITRFNSTLDVIDRTQSSHAQTVTRLMEQSRDSEEVLQQLLIRAERRNALGNALMMVIALILAGGAVFFYIETRNRRPETPAGTPPAPELAPPPAPTPVATPVPTPMPTPPPPMVTPEPEIPAEDPLAPPEIPPPEPEPEVGPDPPPVEDPAPPPADAEPPPVPEGPLDVPEDLLEEAEPEPEPVEVDAIPGAEEEGVTEPEDLLP